MRYRLSGVLLLAGTLRLEPLRDSRVTRSLAALGNASYSIYIWQVSLILVAMAIASRAHMGPWGIFTIVTVFCVGGGLVSYRLVEKPLMSLFRRARRVRGIRVPSGP